MYGGLNWQSGEIEGMTSMMQGGRDIVPLCQISSANQSLVIARWMEVTVILDVANSVLYRVTRGKDGNPVLYTHEPQKGVGRRALLKLLLIPAIFGNRLQAGARMVDTQEACTILNRLNALGISVDDYIWRSWFPGAVPSQNDQLMNWEKTRWQGITVSGVGIVLILLGFFTGRYILLLPGVLLGVAWWVVMMLDKSIKAQWRKKGLIS